MADKTTTRHVEEMLRRVSGSYVCFMAGEWNNHKRTVIRNKIYVRRLKQTPSLLFFYYNTKCISGSSLTNKFKTR